MRLLNQAYIYLPASSALCNGHCGVRFFTSQYHMCYAAGTVTLSLPHLTLAPPRMTLTTFCVAQVMEACESSEAGEAPRLRALALACEVRQSQNESNWLLKLPQIPAL